MNFKTLHTFASIVRVTIAFASISTLAGCSAGSGTGTLSGLPSGASGNVTRVAGGTVTDLGVASITIGPGSLAQDAIVTVSPFSGTLPTSPTGLTYIPGTAVTFDDQNVTLSLGATLTIDYTSTNLGSLTAANIKLYQDVSGVWTLVTGDTLSTSALTDTFGATSLGTYALFAS